MRRLILIVMFLFVPLACAPSGGGNGAVTLQISSPQGEVYTNGELTVQVAVQGRDLAFVDLYLDDQLLVTLSPPFTYTWDTTGTAEGTYALTARHQNVQSNSVPVTVDRTAPSLITQSPAPASSNAYLGDAITAELSEPLDPGSVGPANVRVNELGGGTLTADVALSADERSIEIRLTERPSSLPADVSVTLTDGLTDRAGNAVSLAPWEFTVPAFQSLEMEDPAGRTIRAVDVLADGSPVIVWHEPGNMGLRARVAVWNQNDWDILPDVDFGDLDNDVAWNMALADDGTIYIAGYSSNGPSSIDDPTHVWVVYWDGSQWAPVGDMLNLQGTNSFAFYPDLAFDSTGAPVVAWTEHTSQVFAQHVARFNGIDWTLYGDPLDELQTAYEFDYTQLSVGVDANDFPVVAWTEYNGVDRLEGYAARWTGATWKTLPKINAYAGVTSVGPVKIQVDAQGNVYAAWMERNPSGDFEVFTAIAQSLDWQILGDLNTLVANSSSPSEIDLALSTSGYPVVIWDTVVSQPISQRSCFLGAWNNVGGNWDLIDSPVEVFGGDTPSDRGKITVGGPFNQPIIGWNEDDGTTGNIYLRRYN